MPQVERCNYIRILREKKLEIKFEPYRSILAKQGKEIWPGSIDVRTEQDIQHKAMLNLWCYILAKLLHSRGFHMTTLPCHAPPSSTTRPALNPIQRFRLIRYKCPSRFPVRDHTGRVLCHLRSSDKDATQQAKMFQASSIVQLQLGKHA